MQDWERFGEEIRRTVQDAVDSQDYRKLNSLESLITQRMCGWACLSQKNSAPPPTKGSTYVSISEKLPGNDSVRTGSSLLFPPTHGKQGFPAGLLFFFFSVIKLKLNGYQMSDCPKQSYILFL